MASSLKRRRVDSPTKTSEDTIQVDTRPKSVEDKKPVDGQLSGQMMMSESPEQRAFHNQLVLDSIASYLDLSHLKCLRLVNGPCNIVASSQILKRDLALVKFTYDDKLKKYGNTMPWRNRNDKWKVVTISQFVGMFKKSSPKFPVSDFGFVGGNLAAQELSTLFTLLQGQGVKTLRVLPSTDTGVVAFTNRNDFISLLLHRFPNVETLEIGNFPYQWKTEDRLTLPALKTLICSNNSSFVTGLDMLASAPCLEAVHGFSPKYMEWFLASNKIHAIKDYAYQTMKEDCQDCPIRSYPDKLLPLAKAGLKLQKLELDIKFTSQEQKSTCAALGQILESSKETLKSLRVNIRTFFSGIVFPELTSLQELTLDAIDGFSTYMINALARKFELSTIPNVDTVTIHVLAIDTNGGDTFPETKVFAGHLENVKTLKLYGHCYEPQFGFELFPNVTKIILALDFSFSSDLLSDMLKHYPSLEELEFMNILMNDVNKGSFTTVLGRQPNGISKNSHRHQLPQEFIRDFKCLKRLKLAFKKLNSWGQLSRDVALLPSNLDVTITYENSSQLLTPNMATSLNLVSTRIHIIQEKLLEPNCRHHEDWGNLDFSSDEYEDDIPDSSDDSEEISDDFSDSSDDSGDDNINDGSEDSDSSDDNIAGI